MRSIVKFSSSYVAWPLAALGLLVLGVGACGGDGGGVHDSGVDSGTDSGMDAGGLDAGGEVDSGDGGPPPSGSILGTWVSVSIEVLGMTARCPGQIDLTEDTAVSCATETLTFNDDGTFVLVTTTDDTGAPYDWRTEGMWSTNEDVLTLTFTREGPDAESLQPIDPPQIWIWMWSASEDTLTVGITTPVAAVTSTYDRQ